MPLRIGAGADFAGDRFDPARDLAERGRLDALAFECLAERTLAYGHLARRADPAKGYNPQIERRLGAVLAACVAQGTTILTNMGVANPVAAGRAVVELARRQGLKLRVAVVEGDDLTASVGPGTLLPEAGKTVDEVGRPVVGANAYLGVEAILPALDEEPHVVITGRVADPSLFLAPMVHRYGWTLDDWQRLGAGTAIGHLLECTTQVTGGYFADPPYKTVPDIAYLGFPFAEVDADGSGDKGDISCVSVWVYDPRDYEAVKAGLTAERVAAAYPALFRGAVRRYEVPGLHGLNFVMEAALEGGVNASLNLDAHGKSFSYLILALDVEVDRP